MNTKSKQSDNFKNFLPYLVLTGVVLVVIFALNMQGSTINELTTGELISALKDDTVTEITVTPKSDESIYIIEGKLEDYKSIS